MRTFLKIFILVGLLVIVINGISGNSFSTESYVNNLTDNLEPFPRFTNDDDLEFEDYPVDFDVESFLTFFRNAGRFFKIVWYILSYPIKIIIWIFKMIYVVFANLIVWS